jgi:hypothetical protein
LLVLLILVCLVQLVTIQETQKVAVVVILENPEVTQDSAEVVVAEGTRMVVAPQVEGESLLEILGAMLLEEEVEVVLLKTLAQVLIAIMVVRVVHVLAP